MKIGLFTDGLAHLPFAAALDFATARGISAVEIGTGNYSPAPHCDLSTLLTDHHAREAFHTALADRGLELSALNCSGNVLHPDPSVSGPSQGVFRDTVLLASLLGLDRIVTMSGCPGAPDGSRLPQWVTLKWPPEMARLLNWQWDDVILPFWREQAEFARSHGVRRIALEIHPGMAVYNPPTLLRLRREIGPTIGANFDPSRFFWQGMDPSSVALELSGCVFHSHAKDTFVDRRAVEMSGVLNAEWPEASGPVSWWFTTMGYGHDALFWKSFYYNLYRGGYDDVLSIEYEDPHLSAEVSITKAAQFLGQVMV
ncbi:MAG: sugar phosphate isomerase/epimerase [Chloroflexi bacterium]|nr:sugar phosphate isomerase/epimerase [Chloroflexota bacterium]